MSIRERLSQLIAPASKAQGQGQMVPGIVGLQMPSTPVYSDITVRKATREGYKINVAVYRAVRTIVQAMSGIPWVVQDEDGEEIEGHQFTQVLQRPNEHISSQDLMEILGSHLLLPGNALWQPLVIGHEIREIWPVMPDLVKPVPSDKPGVWLECWQVTDVRGKQTEYPPETFIHFMQFDPGNPYWGVGPLMAAARTIDTDNEAQDTQKITMQNRAVPDGVFKPKLESMTPDQFEEANRQIRELYLKKSNRGAPWVVTADYTRMAMTAIEMDYIASRLQNKRDIASAYSLDPWWLGDREHSTYNNVHEARMSLYEDAVIPMLDDIKATLNLIVPRIYGQDIVITYDTSGVPALRDDYGKKSETAQRFWQMGVPMNQLNDLLELKLTEFEGWGQSYVPMSMVPLGTEMPGLPEESEEGVEEEEEEKPEGGETVETEEEEEAGKQAHLHSERRSFNLQTEEQKTLHWKRVDGRRQSYWPVVTKRVQRLFGAEGEAIAQAVHNAQGGANSSQALVKRAKAAISSLRPRWEKELTAISAVLIQDFGNRTAEDLGGKPKGMAANAQHKDSSWVFDPFTLIVRQWLSQHVTESVTVIAGTSLKEVSQLIEQGYAANMTTVEISREIRKFYDEKAYYRSMTTARTEIGSAAGFGQREAAKQSGIVKGKGWVSSRDDRVRDSHKDIDGQRRPLNEKYGNNLMYPGDMSGSPGEFIMCRCTESYYT